jgi:hypothetical protein
MSSGDATPRHTMTPAIASTASEPRTKINLVLDRTPADSSRNPVFSMIFSYLKM